MLEDFKNDDAFESQLTSNEHLTQEADQQDVVHGSRSRVIVSSENSQEVEAEDTISKSIFY